jgi:uncharacterized protein
VSDPTVQVSDAPDEDRYEARVDGDLAGFASYRLRGERIIFTHTEVEPAYEGKGVGSTLAKAALDDARGRGLTVVVQCPFISAYIRRHPEYADLTG